MAIDSALKHIACFLLLMLLAGCAISRADSVNPGKSTQKLNLPEFVDDPEPGVNEDIAAPRQKLIYYKNYAAMEEILKHDPAVVHQEMLKRMSADQPMSLRLIAAAVLVFLKDESGRQFFRDQSKKNESLGDLYVTLNHIAWSTKYLTGSEVDFSWAEDFMIEALQNRTRVNRRDAFYLSENRNWQDPTIEIRELAVQYGSFSDHLAKTKSEKALPIILALLRENSFYSLKRSISYLGRYRDDRVAPLLMDILNHYEISKRDDTYGFAVGAATEMGLKKIVPILLRHLNDVYSYGGLIELADASVVPTIKSALPHLKLDARAEAELAIVYLQGGDLVPSLMQLFRRKNYPKRTDVVYKLGELRDPRSVPTIAAALCYDHDYYVRFGSLRALAAVRDKAAMQALVKGLECDYSKVQRGKTRPDHDFNREYREEIAKTLTEITGQRFGSDQKQWTRWLSQQ